MALTQAQIDQLNSAALKTDKTATDIANIDYATKNYGYTAPTTAAPSFTVPTGYERVDNVASLPNYSTTIKDPNSVAIYGIPKQQNVGDLGNNNPIVPAPTPTVPTDMNSFVSGLKGGQTSATNLGDIMNLTSPEVQTATQQNQGLTQKLLDQLSKLTGRSQQTEELTVKAGIPEAQKQLADLNVQIAQKTANFDKALVDEQGKPILNAIIGGRTSLIQRQKAVELGGLSAVAQAMQGNISAAQNTIKETVQMEYQDQLDQIDSLKTQLEVNYNNFTMAQKDLADKQSVLLDERSRLLTEQSKEREEVLNLAISAAQNGAPASVSSSMSKAKTIDEAIQISGGFLGPQVIASVKSSSGSGSSGGGGIGVNGLTKVEISDAAQSWVDLINSGKATISNVPAALKTEVAQGLQSNQAPITQTKEQSDAQQKITLIDSLLTSNGLNSAVGPTSLARGKIDLPFGISIPYGADYYTGANASFIGGVEQLISQDTLQTLLDLKKGGGTLGALSDQERIMLKSAASKIGNWAITDKTGKVTGYNIDQTSFKTELNRIKSLAQKALGNANSPEIQTMSDGTRWRQNADGTYTQI